MADTGVGQMLATSGRSAISGSAGSHQKVDRGLGREGTLNSERRIEKQGEANQSGFPVSLVVVIEQWICLGLGMICMISGTLGISMSTGQNDLSAHLAWGGMGIRVSVADNSGRVPDFGYRPGTPGGVPTADRSPRPVPTCN